MKESLLKKKKKINAEVTKLQYFLIVALSDAALGICALRSRGSCDLTKLAEPLCVQSKTKQKKTKKQDIG